MNSLKKELLNLALGEFAALCTFIFVYRSLNIGMASFIAFSYLILINSPPVSGEKILQKWGDLTCKKH